MPLNLTLVMRASCLALVVVSMATLALGADLPRPVRPGEAVSQDAAARPNVPVSQDAAVLPSAAASPEASPESDEALTTETIKETSRLRTSVAYYRFNINHVAVTGEGPDFNFESAVSDRWAASAGVAQVFTLSANVQTLFTSIEGGLWYSVLGTFPRESQRWKERGNTVVAYRGQAKGGLRVGMSLQQYFFNTSKATVPFSGVAFRALYELGLALPCDVGIGLEAARLSNPDSKAQSVKGVLSLIWSFQGN